MKHKEKVWKEKLKIIENEINNKKLNEEIERIKKPNLPAVFVVILGPGYIYAQIAMRHFLKVKAEASGDKQKYNELTVKIKSLWNIFFISIAFWIIAAIVIVNIISNIILRH